MLWLSLAVLVVGCGRNITAKQLNEPCTRTAQCEPPLVCLVGVCVPNADAGVDGGADGGE